MSLIKYRTRKYGKTIKYQILDSIIVSTVELSAIRVLRFFYSKITEHLSNKK